MTIEPRLARAGFTLTRDYPVHRERVWDAFANEGRFHDGPVSRYVATYTDIVEHVRIVTTYDMWLDGVHMSTSVASLANWLKPFYARSS